MTKNSVKPLELVLSAIHSLKDAKGSSPQNILRYLVQKFNIKANLLKPYVQTGLLKGLNLGLITQESGTYRLNDVLSVTSGSDNKRPCRKLNKLHKRIGKRKLTKPKISGRRKRKRFKMPSCLLSKKKVNRKAKKRKRTVLGIKRKKQQKLKTKVARKSKKKGKQQNEVVKKAPEVRGPSPDGKTEGGDATESSAKT